MLLSYNWLKKYVDTRFNPDDLGQRFLMTSSELERSINWGDRFDKVFTAKVKSVEPHPNADKLKVTQVAVGAKQLQVVCGAPNVQAGQTVLLALPGAQVVNSQGEYTTLAAVEIRGVKSEGMLGAATEFGLPMIHEPGIWVLPSEIKPGLPAADALGFNDTVLDLEITPNRPDLLSYLGLSREVSCFENRTLELPKLPKLSTANHTNLVAKIAKGTAVARLSALRIKLNQNTQSPWWLQRSLILAGMRPINPVVDITNFVMLEYGQPLHAFDTNLISSSEKSLTVCADTVTKATQIETIDQQNREIQAGDLVITINNQIADVGGIMGGRESAIQTSTEEILLTATNFSGASIRRTSRRLGLRTEASSRFEKGLDPELTVPALARAVMLLQEIGVIESFSSLVDTYPHPLPKPNPIPFRVETFESLIGIHVNITEAKRILERLGFTITKMSKSGFQATPPSWRQDISLKEDIIEEVVRIWGYERIPQTLPSGKIKAPQLNHRFERLQTVRQQLAQFGLQEIVSPSFMSQADANLFQISDYQPLDNPLATDQELILSSHLVTFLNLIKENPHLVRSYFEIGHLFSSNCTEEERISALHWGVPAEIEATFRQAITAISLIFAQPIKLVSSDLSHFCPNRSWEIMIDGKLVGEIGVVADALLKAKKVRKTQSIIYWSVNADSALKPKPPVQYRQFSSYPAIERDITFISKEALTWDALEASIDKNKSQLVNQYRFINLYRGPNLPDHSKATTVHFTYQAADSTLTDAEVDLQQSELIAKVCQELEVTISS